MRGIVGKLLIAGLLSLLLVGCSESPSGPSAQGKIRVYLTDAPADFEAVNVPISEVSVHFVATGEEEGEWIVITDEPQEYNLLELAAGNKAILGKRDLKPGLYTQIRLKVESAEVKVDGSDYTLEVPSGARTGIKLVHQFTIEEDKLYEILLDFDAGRSVVETGNGRYLLTPTIRAIPIVISGTISGKVLPLDAEAFISVYTSTFDTVSTAFADPSDGTFLVNAIPEGTYLVGIDDRSGKYSSKVLENIEVIARQNKDIGTITLESP